MAASRTIGCMTASVATKRAAHEIGDPGIALEAAEVPVQPVEILLGVERREQGLRARIVVGIIERLHRDLQQDLVALRARPLGQFGGIGAIGRKCQRHRRRQFHDGVGGLGGADAKAADHDGDHRHFRRLGAVGLGGIDGERLEPVGDHRDHAVARFFQQARIDPGHQAGRGVRLGLVGGIAAGTDHDVLARAARAVDDGDGLLLGRCGLLGGGSCSRLGMRRMLPPRRAFRPAAGGLAQRDARDRLAAERIVVEHGDAEEGDQKQAEQHRQRLDGR